ncbi:MAG: TRAP transporter large permease [Clostridiales Family XIII bacterium]|jgi:tripartite ATP-independent transporter DctM subunit|nr:TRAP transporter large permease [Clostridiales Family XIII bacterium]
MSIETIGIIGVALVIVLMMLRMQVGWAMMLVGFFGCLYLQGWDFTTTVLGLIPFSSAQSYSMSCLPLFIMMGIVLAESGLGAALFDFASKWLGRVKGSLAMATAVACGFFAAICGDSVTTAVTMGKVAFPEMIRYKYSPKLAGAVIACGGTVGILIPPSMCFIIYGTITEQSIGKLFMAGFIPGILQILFYVIVISILVRVRKDFAPSMLAKVPMREKWKATGQVWPVVLIFLIIMGGMYGGLFTPTEAAAFGAFASIVVGFVTRRLKIKSFGSALMESAKNSAMTYFILIGAYVFMRFMTMSNLPVTFGNAIVNLNAEHGVPRLAILGLIILMYIVFGAFMDVFATILLTLPIIFPVIVQLGYDPIWFGVIITRMMELGMISPPFGINLFAIAKVTKTPISQIYAGVWPFLAADVVHVAMLIAFPQISLWLAGGGA